MSAIKNEFSKGFADAVEAAGRSVVSISEGGRAGVSGTMWRDGLIVTAEHTIRGRQQLTIGLPTGNSSSATVVGGDRTTDIALLRLADASPTQIEFAPPETLRVGFFVLAIGRRATQGLVATHGMVSAIGGPWRTWHGGRIDRRLRLDLLPFRSFSGGPLVDTQGRVIGMNTSGPRRSVMTLPAMTVDRVVDQLLAKGRIVRGFIGAGLQPVQLPPNVASSAESQVDRGLLVVMLEPGGPAEKAGLIVGDIVLSIGNTVAANLADLQSVLDPEQVGTTVVLRVLRGGKAQEFSLTIGERPD
jgi:S1-C subfamily serine protease